MLNNVSPAKIITPKMMFAKDTLRLASFGGNKKVSRTTEMHLELLTMFIKTKSTPQTILRFVRKSPKNTIKEVTITSLSKSITFTVWTSLLLY